MQSHFVLLLNQALPSLLLNQDKMLFAHSCLLPRGWPALPVGYGGIPESQRNLTCQHQGRQLDAGIPRLTCPWVVFCWVAKYWAKLSIYDKYLWVIDEMLYPCLKEVNIQELLSIFSTVPITLRCTLPFCTTSSLLFLQHASLRFSVTMCMNTLPVLGGFASKA